MTTFSGAHSLSKSLVITVYVSESCEGGIQRPNYVSDGNSHILLNIIVRSEQKKCSNSAVVYTEQFKN